VNFKNTIIVMTSNIPTEEVRSYLRPEFINRIDEIITFIDLDEDVILEIVSLQVDEAIQMLNAQGIELSVDPKVNIFLQVHGYQPEYGARPIKRMIRQHILAPVSRYLLANPTAIRVHVSEDNGMISIHD